MMNQSFSKGERDSTARASYPNENLAQPALALRKHINISFVLSLDTRTMSTAQHPQAKAQQAGNQLLSHPYAQQAMAIANNNLKQLDRQLSQFPVLNSLEAQTRVPKAYGVLSMVGSFIFLIFFNLFGLASPVSNLIGWALPAYLSCGALESPGKDDDKQWLTYWVVFGLLNFIESAGLRVVLYYLPFYFLFKTLFTIWLMLPQTRGAEVLWRNVVQPFYRSMSGSIQANTPVTGYSTTTTSFELQLKYSGDRSNFLEKSIRATCEEPLLAPTPYKLRIPVMLILQSSFDHRLSSKMATQHRLHISGLTPAVTPSDLKERFQRYGNVKSVDTVGPDALGINSMQNSIWRGAKLKIAPAKKSYEEKLASERLNDIERKALLNDKDARKLRIKERKERKRRLAKAGGGRQSGDMRLMTEENWKNEGDIWRGKYWRLTPTHHLIRPIFTRPTHPLHIKPVSSASENAIPLPITKKGDKYEELGSLGKKVKKPRSLPPKRAMRMLLDPFRYGHMHLNGAILEGIATSVPVTLPEGRWIFTYDDMRLDDISSRLDPSLVGGTWTFHPPAEPEALSLEERIPESAEVISGKRKRVADQLNEIARHSVFADTVQDVVNKHVDKKSKTGQPGDHKAKKASYEDPHVLRLDDEDIPTLDDDDIWGAVPVTMEKESVSLFDSNPAKSGAASQPRPLTKLVPVVTASSDEENPALSDVEFEDDDALFGESQPEADLPASPLFDKKVSHRMQARAPSGVIPEEHSADDAFDDQSTGVGLSLGGFVDAEKAKGLSVLQKLGINFSKKDKSPQLDALNAVDFDDSGDEGNNVTDSNAKVYSAAWLYDADDDDEPIETFRSATRRLSGSELQVELSNLEADSVDSEASFASHGDDNVEMLESAAGDIDSRHAFAGAHAPVKTAGNGTKSTSNSNSTSSTSSSSDDTSDESEDDKSEDEGNGQGSSGNGDGGKGDDGNGGKKDEDDTASDSDSSSDEEDSSSDDDDDEDAEKKQKSAKQNARPEKQSLKDMFAAQPEATTGFSLMAGLDLELDSDLEMDEANPFEPAAPVAREAEPTLTAFAPIPAVDVNAVFNASSSNEPFFFGTTARPPGRTEDIQDGWMNKITIGGIEKQEVDVEPFWQTETDEQMTQLWNEQKRELTKEYKKRHREAVKRQKRGMGGAGPSADGGGAMDVE
ncbi:hypothetical protein QFC19_001887 [Naganishia cerealis]|uniref:Uncharacterized protein n=1 Tax=Naganishia cerealis TaxID=610337 RepID=A0ACC2WH85_9TREE|nr:hypothetical protein QFC19_001887 [Naganishia cerealis]